MYKLQTCPHPKCVNQGSLYTGALPLSSRRRREINPVSPLRPPLLPTRLASGPGHLRQPSL